jgi:hypothetical protein
MTVPEKPQTGKNKNNAPPQYYALRQRVLIIPN